MSRKVVYVHPQMLASGNVVELDGADLTVESIIADWDNGSVEVKFRGRTFPVVIPMKRDLKVVVEDHLTPVVKVPVTLYLYVDAWDVGDAEATAKNGLTQIEDAFEGVKIVQAGEATLVNFNDDGEEVIA